MTIDELKRQYPMPWSYTTFGNQVIMSDREGKEVPMFLMLDLVQTITRQLSEQYNKEEHDL